MKFPLVAAFFCTVLAFQTAIAAEPFGAKAVALPGPPQPPPIAAMPSASAGSGIVSNQATAPKQTLQQYCNSLADKEGLSMANRTKFLTACLRN
jgi:hypothetical protein